MTVKEWREKTPLKEQKEFATKLQTWLGEYTQEVFERVMKRMDEIISNEFALKMIDELHEREQKEIAQEISHIEFALGHDGMNLDGFHNHPLEHAKAYREVLYDMYIKKEVK